MPLHVAGALLWLITLPQSNSFFEPTVLGLEGSLSCFWFQRYCVGANTEVSKCNWVDSVLCYVICRNKAFKTGIHL